MNSSNFNLSILAFPWGHEFGSPIGYKLLWQAAWLFVITCILIDLNYFAFWMIFIGAGVVAVQQLTPARSLVLLAMCTFWPMMVLFEFDALSPLVLPTDLVTPMQIDRALFFCATWLASTILTTLMAVRMRYVRNPN